MHRKESAREPRSQEAGEQREQRPMQMWNDLASRLNLTPSQSHITSEIMAIMQSLINSNKLAVSAQELEQIQVDVIMAVTS